MKSKILICTICIETALAITFAVAAVQSYGRAVPSTCLKSRSSLMTQPCATPSVTPMPRTAVWRNISTNSTAKEGWATWYSTNSVIKDYKNRGQAIPTNGVFLMANGKPLDDTKTTCALWITNKYGRPRFPDGRLVKITNVENVTGIGVIIAWTDNGPGSVPRSRGVIADLTPAAMRALAGEAGIKAGRVAVTVEAL